MLLFIVPPYSLTFLKDKKEKYNQNETKALFIDNSKTDLLKRIFSYFLEQNISILIIITQSLTKEETNYSLNKRVLFSSINTPNFPPKRKTHAKFLASFYRYIFER